MNTLDILVARARRSRHRVQTDPTERASAEYTIDVITVAIAQAVASGRVLDRMDDDGHVHEERVARLAHLLCGDPDREVVEVVDTWHEQHPDDDIVEQLRSALLVLDGADVTPTHWLRAGAAAAN